MFMHSERKETLFRAASEALKDAGNNPLEWTSCHALLARRPVRYSW